MDKNNWHKLKLVQKVDISIRTESLEFGSAIRRTRKFRNPTNSLGARLLGMSGFNDLARRPKTLSLNGKCYKVNPNLSRVRPCTLNFFLWFALSAKNSDLCQYFCPRL